MMGTTFTINGRIWLEINGEKVLGHGRVELLERIHNSGSIRQAAIQMKMSYKQAWDIINHMNNCFSSAVVISRRGGKGGGYAIVTENGLDIIREFHRLQEELRKFLNVNSVKID